MKTTKLAKELPRHKSYPRLVAIPASYAGLFGGKPEMKVRLTCSRFISTARWNELGQLHDTFEAQFAAAKAEANAAELKTRAEVAQILNAAARTELSIEAAEAGLSLPEYVVKLAK